MKKFKRALPARRRSVLPRQIPPKSTAVEYARALRKLMRIAFEVYRPLLEALAEGTVRKATGERTDATYTATRIVKTTTDPRALVRPTYTATRIVKTTTDPRALVRPTYTPTKVSTVLRISGQEAKDLLDDARDRLEAAVSISRVEALADKFATRTSDYQRVQLGRQVKTAFGADPFVREPELERAQQDFVAQNVSLIKRIPTRLHDRIEGLVMNAVGKAELNVDLAKEVQQQFGVSERHAILVARDQISKYYGAVNRARQQGLGLRRFVWRTVNDERVRDSHADLEGQTFSWDDLPVNERGEQIYPGSDYQCRCSAEPVLDDLLNDLGETDAEAPLEIPVEASEDAD